MSGVEIAGGKVLIERAVPAGIARLRPVLTGKRIIIVGPPGSGKTTFAEYLRSEAFFDVQPHETTQDLERSRSYELSVGGKRARTVTIRTAVDTPGQYLPKQLAEQIYNERPHALIIVLDITDPDATEWFQEFSIRLDQRWQGARRRRNRLKFVLVALNKIDKLDPATDITETERAYREIAQQHWKAARGARMDDVMFRRSVLVRNTDDDELAREIVVALVKALEKKR
jgi:GTPase SAR1 family protein